MNAKPCQFLYWKKKITADLGTYPPSCSAVGYQMMKNEKTHRPESPTRAVVAAAVKWVAYAIRQYQTRPRMTPKSGTSRPPMSMPASAALCWFEMRGTWSSTTVLFEEPGKVVVEARGTVLVERGWWMRQWTTQLLSRPSWERVESSFNTWPLNISFTTLLAFSSFLKCFLQKKKF